MTDRLDEAARAACNTYAAEMMAPGMSYDGFNERVKNVWRDVVKAALSVMQGDTTVDYRALAETHEQRWRRLGFPFEWFESRRAYEYSHTGDSLQDDWIISLPTIQAVDEWIERQVVESVSTNVKINR